MINVGTEDTLVLCFQGLNHHCALFYCSDKAPVSMSEGSFERDRDLQYNQRDDALLPSLRSKINYTQGKRGKDRKT